MDGNLREPLLPQHDKHSCCSTAQNYTNKHPCPCSSYMGDAGSGCTCSHLHVKGSRNSIVSLCVCTCSSCTCNNEDALKQVSACKMSAAPESLRSAAGPCHTVDGKLLDRTLINCFRNHPRCNHCQHDIIVATLRDYLLQAGQLVKQLSTPAAAVSYHAVDRSAMDAGGVAAAHALLQQSDKLHVLGKHTGTSFKAVSCLSHVSNMCVR